MPYVCVCVYIYSVCVCVCIYIYIYMCIYIYIYIYAIFVLPQQIWILVLWAPSLTGFWTRDNTLSLSGLEFPV